MKYTTCTMNPRHVLELADLHPKLHAVLTSVLAYWRAPTFSIKSIYRTPEHDRSLGGSGVHATRPHRAIDIGIRMLAPTKSAMWGAACVISRRINREFQYDPTRPHLKVAVCKPHGTGPHIHLQVHPRTRSRQ